MSSTDPDLSTLEAFRSTWISELPDLYQHRLLNERDLTRFASERGVSVVPDEVMRLHSLGWLASDGVGFDDSPQFHPFRIHQLREVLGICSFRIAATSTIDRERLEPFLLEVAKGLPDADLVDKVAARANRAVSLAMLLEPAQWPHVSGQVSYPGFGDQHRFQRLQAEYHAYTIELTRRLKAEEWQKVHEQLRFRAASMDENGSLYLLLRLAPWSRRERIRGRIGGAMWIRHIAEVIRRAFEEALRVEWMEEDQGFGMWMRGGRVREYGSERPLDRITASKPYLAFAFGLHTSSVVRWYLEGDTEYGAVTEALPGAAIGGIEIINLKGSVETKQGVPLKLADALKQDLALKRFSFITCDLDEPNALRTIRGQVKSGNVVGAVFAHNPDFEFANFELSELVEIAASFDDDAGHDGSLVRRADWSGIAGGRAFEKRYASVSACSRSLKGQAWGVALAKYAFANPLRATGERRPFLEAIDTVLHSRGVRYDFHKGTHAIDPKSLQLVRLAEPADPWKM